MAPALQLVNPLTLPVTSDKYVSSRFRCVQSVCCLLIMGFNLERNFQSCFCM